MKRLHYRILTILIFVLVLTTFGRVTNLMAATYGSCGSGSVSTVDTCGIGRSSPCYYTEPYRRAVDCYPVPLSGSATEYTGKCLQYAWRPIGCTPSQTPVSNLFAGVPCQWRCILWETRTCTWNFKSDACGGVDSTPDPSVCTGCDCTLPTCANANGGNTDYTTAVTGSLCLGQPATCTKKDSCNLTCGTPSTKEQACYHKETNLTKPAVPSNIYLNIDGVSYTLSSDPNNPTLVRYPSSSTSTTQISASLVSKPVGSREYGYRFYDNLANKYLDRFAVTYDGKTPPINLAPTGRPKVSDLTENATRFVAANVYGRNLCDEGTQEDAPIGQIRRGYYKVNTLPTTTTTITPASSSSTSKGCTVDGRYTGQEANNELKITVSGTDTNDNNSINGAIIWLVKEGNNIDDTKRVANIESGIPLATPNRIGIFVDSGSNVYVANIDSSNKFTSWRSAQSDSLGKYINSSTGKIVSSIRSSRPAVNRYEITLKFPKESVFSGSYRLYTAMTDTLSYMSLGSVKVVDSRKLTTSSETWNFDFLNPTVTNIISNYDTDSREQRILKLTWNSDGTGTGIHRTVLNTYTSSTTGITEIQRNDLRNPFTPSNNTSNVGKIPTTPTNVVINGNEGWWYEGKQTSAEIDIMYNDSGSFSFPITVYDQACNSGSGSTNPINMDKWISTQGGIFYSQGSINYPPKSIDNYNLATELLTSKSGRVQGYRALGTLSPAVGINIKDNNDNSYYFTALENNLKEHITALNITPNTTTLGNLSCAGVCVYTGQDISITTGTTYSGKIMVYATGNITVTLSGTSNVTTGSSSGLYLFAGGNITVKSDGSTSSSSTLVYDKLDSFLIAKGNVIIENDDNASNIQQDGISITGGIIAFGVGSPSPAFQLRRNLGLQNISYPALVVNYHPKYGHMSEVFFGLDTKAYKQEVGFKPG